MKYYILTRNRQNNQITLGNLPKSIMKDVWLVVPYGQENNNWKNTLYTPPEIVGIGPTRQWVLDNPVQGDPYIAMFDDDLNFNMRKISTEPKLFKLNDNEDLVKAFDILWEWNETIPLVSISCRQGNNNVLEDYADNTRVLRNFFINKKLISNERFDRIELMEDYDFELQLLRNKKPNRVLYTFSQDQVRSNAPGGCSDYRTAAKQTEAAFKLAELHPGFVKVKEKKTKTEWFGDGVRTDVIIYWKKAYNSGVPANK